MFQNISIFTIFFDQTILISLCKRKSFAQFFFVYFWTVVYVHIRPVNRPVNRQLIVISVMQNWGSKYKNIFLMQNVMHLVNAFKFFF